MERQGLQVTWGSTLEAGRATEGNTGWGQAGPGPDRGEIPHLGGGKGTQAGLWWGVGGQSQGLLTPQSRVLRPLTRALS